MTKGLYFLYRFAILTYVYEYTQILPDLVEVRGFFMCRYPLTISVPEYTQITTSRVIYIVGGLPGEIERPLVNRVT
jgi:hypothetical protein